MTMLRFRFPLAALENLLASREDQAKALAGRAAADRRPDRSHPARDRTTGYPC